MTSDAFQPEDFGIGRLFKHVRDGVVVADAQTERIVLWNTSAETMFGYSEQEALEIPLHALVPERLRERHRAGLAAYQATGTGTLVEGGRPVELVGVHKDGYEIPIELTLTRVPEMTPDGHRFALAIVRDISERKKAEESQRLLDQVRLDRQHAFELNDTIVQGLSVAKLAFEEGKSEMGLEAVAATLKQAQGLVSRMLEQIEATQGPIKPGDLVREEGAPSA